MSSTKIIISGLLCFFALHANSVTNNNSVGGSVVTPGKRHKSTPRQLATMTVWTDINKYLPNKPRYRTLGMLVKLCDFIVIADILDISYDLKSADGIVSKRAFIVFNIKVENSIFGELDTDKLIIKFDNYLRALPVKKGDKVVLFLADYPWYNVDNYEVLKWNFKHGLTARQDEKDLQLIYYYDGMINVTDEKAREQIVDAVKGYLHIFRNGDEDPDEYYMLLSKLLTSENQLIKENAIQDMFLFCKSYEKFDLQRAMNDPNLEDGMKKIIYYHTQPSRSEDLIEAEMKRLSE